MITVGASEGVRAAGTDGCGTPDTGADSARDVANFSSRGPTDDGRLKPDLVAPGTHVTGARPQHGSYTGSGTCNPFFVGTYSLVSGTSQAAPQVAGAAALVRDWYVRTQGSAPSPALTKAVLIDTARRPGRRQQRQGRLDRSRPERGPGLREGGRGRSDRRHVAPFLRPVGRARASGDRSVRAFTVQDASKPVKVTLVWTDAPGPIGGNAFVNNLDLEVAGGGNTYLGNVFGGAYSRTGGSADVRNNVESVRPAARHHRVGSR